MLLSLVVGEDVDVDGFSIFFLEKKRTAKKNQTFLYHEKMSHDEQPPLIWFHLFDSDGQPYKEITVSSVSLNPSAAVDELRLAVVNKNPRLWVLLSSKYTRTRLPFLEEKRL